MCLEDTKIAKMLKKRKSCMAILSKYGQIMGIVIILQTKECDPSSVLPSVTLCFRSVRNLEYT